MKMTMQEVRSLGGKATGIISRKAALDKYYENPNKCISCDSVIVVLDNKKVSEIKKMKFCNHTCAAIFTNKKRDKKPIKIKIKKVCLSVEEKAERRFNFLKGKTKDEIFSKHSNWQSARTSIRNHAGKVYAGKNMERECENCGYNKHVEIAHIKSVSSFSGSATIEEMNHVNNLIGLCPNCHWEFDNGLLKIQGGIEQQ